MRISSKYIGLMAVLVLIILSSGCLDNSDDSGNVTMLNKTANGTYSVAGVSFKCPDNWAVDMINENGNVSIISTQMHEIKSGGTTLSFDDPQFELHITPSNSTSDQEAINQIKNENSEVGNRISSTKMVLDGQSAYKDVVISNDTVEVMRFEYIYFVKNGKTYLITFSAKDKDFNKEKANFDMILNSLKIQ